MIAGAEFRGYEIRRALLDLGVEPAVGETTSGLPVQVRWSRTNEHDPRAMGIYLAQWHIGFVPRFFNVPIHARAVEIQPRHQSASVQIIKRGYQEYEVVLLVEQPPDAERTFLIAPDLRPPESTLF